MNPPSDISANRAPPSGISSRFDDHKTEISRLYAENKLQDVMRIMREKHNFRATMKQYKSQIRKWGLDTKRIKGSEYMGILKHKRKREKEKKRGNTRFYLREKEVPLDNIARFEHRMIRQGKITESDTLSEIGTPEALRLSTSTPSTWSASPVFRTRTPATSALHVTTQLGNQPLSPYSKALEYFVLYNGSVDDLSTAPNNNPDLYRLTFTPSPGLRSSSRMKSPRPFATINTVSDAPKTPLVIPKSPNLDGFSWFSHAKDFALSPSQVPSAPLTNLKAEQTIRRFAIKIDNYEDRCYFEQVLHPTGYCTDCLDCNAKLGGYHTRCYVLRLAWKLEFENEYNRLTSPRYVRLLAHILYTTLADVNLASNILFDVSLYLAVVGVVQFSYDELCEIELSLLESDYWLQDLKVQTRYCCLELTLLYALVGKFDNSFRLFQRVLKEDYTKVCSLADFCSSQGYSGSDTHFLAANYLSDGLVQAPRNEDAPINYIFSCPHSMNPDQERYYLKHLDLQVVAVSRLVGVYQVQRQFFSLR
ncbi:hypothetical protein BS50DRAFT_567862 [Corynespora cassiicola Philippines]|uniref:Clr5 domain-containing protein n=1 Tax=Corynespora cassiicola Philippines TaxID=1448308 RepID=A0A2T2PBX9_CORCC|nr:hypothetical protein BS50DRAFT_567862 [Corynespora cassiicola Philippines]